MRAREPNELEIQIREGRETNCRIALSEFHQGSDSDLLSWETAFQIIVNNVLVDPPLPILVKRPLFNSAIDRWRKNNSRVDEFGNLWPTFERTLKTELAALMRNEDRCTVLAFLNLDRSQTEVLDGVSIDEYVLHFPGWNELERFEMNKLWDYVYKAALKQGSRPPHPPNFSIFNTPAADDLPKYQVDRHTFVPVLISLITYHPNAAVSIADEVLNILRAALNLAPAVNLYMHHTSASYLTLNKILPPPIYGVFDDLGRLGTNFYQSRRVYEYQYRRRALKAQWIDFALPLLQEFNEAPTGSSNHFLFRLFLLYQQALDRTDPQAIYLGLWQVLEALTFNQPEKGSTVNKKVKTLLRLSTGDLWYQALSTLADIRNEFVHGNIFPEHREWSIFVLKSLVDGALTRLYHLARDLADEAEIEAYYTYASKNSADLEAELSNASTAEIENVIRYIQGERAA